MFLPTVGTQISAFTVMQKDVIVGSQSSKLDGQVRNPPPHHMGEADGGTSPGAGATGRLRHWLMSGRSYFTVPETSQFLAETFVAVAQANGEKRVKCGSLGDMYDAL